LVSANEVKKLISSTKKYVLLFLKENQTKDDSIRVKASLAETSFGGVVASIQRSVPGA
jgi:hypothetical protein